MSPESSSEARKVAKAASVVGAFTIIVFLTAFVWRWLSAPYLGSTPVGNAFNWAYPLIIGIFWLWEKFLRPTVIPVYMQEREERGEDSAWRFVSSLFNLQIVLLAVLTVVGIMLVPRIVNIFGPGFDEEHRTLAGSMLRWLFVALPFLALSVMGYLMLNAGKRFALAASGDWVLKVAMAVGLVALYGWWGWRALVVAVLVGGLVKFLMYLFGLRGELRHYRCILDLKSQAMKRFYALIVPLSVGAIYSYVRDLIELRFRSAVLEGRATSLVVYGRMPVDVAIQVLMRSLGIALFPFICEAAARKKDEELFRSFFTICRGIFLVFLPLTVALIVMRTPMIRTLLEWKNFTPSDTELTSQVVFYYAFACIPLALEIIILQYFFARQNTLIPTIVGLGSSTLRLAFIWLLIPRLGVGAFTLAVVLEKTLKVLILVPLLKLVFPGKHDWWAQIARLLNGLVRVGAATAAMTLVLLGFDYVLTAHLNLAGKVQGFIYLGILVSGGSATYLVMVILLRVEEAKLIFDWVMKKVRSKSGIHNSES